VTALVVAVAAAGAARAEQVYQQPAAFLADAFGGDVPKPRKLWLAGATRDGAAAILGHEPDALRIRYWAHGDRSAWILDEIGKVKPITAGIVIDEGAIEHVRVLVFRETRGWEVRQPFFTDQFRGARLDGARHLDRVIDGISGATLSADALTRLARLALFLDRCASGGGDGS